MDANIILNFWFNDLTPKDWFSGEVRIDNLIRDRFLQIHEQASHGELYSWRKTAEGRLAEIIILDQFSRNIFRNNPNAFATDTVALVLAEEAVSLGQDKLLLIEKRKFMYMPFMHSESKVVHEVAIVLFSTPGLENNLDYELKHKKIIDRFGRYPHRNKILGRVSTSEEIEFLKEPDSSF